MPKEHFIGTTFVDANITEVNFSGADFSGATFTGANLSVVDLTESIRSRPQRCRLLRSDVCKRQSHPHEIRRHRLDRCGSVQHGT